MAQQGYYQQQQQPPAFQQQPSFQSQPSYNSQPSYGQPAAHPQAAYMAPGHTPNEKAPSQPMLATPAMSMAPGGGNRNSRNKPFNAEGKREWSNGFCGCCDDAGTCFIAWCCPCIVYGQNKQRLDHLERKGYPDPEQGGCVNNDCLIHGLVTSCFGVGFIFQMITRGNMRQRYGIAGGSCGDCCATCCCTPCTLTQESIEIGLEEQSFAGQIAGHRH